MAGSSAHQKICAEVTHARRARASKSTADLQRAGSWASLLGQANMESLLSALLFFGKE
jgi:hypothetical protein